MIPAGHDSAVRIGVTSWGSGGAARGADWMAEVAGQAETADQLAVELRRLAGWLDLDDVVVAPRGDLAGPLGAALT